MEQNYFIWHEKIRENLRQVIRKVKKKGEFESPKSESLVFQRRHLNHAWTLWSCLGIHDPMIMEDLLKKIYIPFYIKTSTKQYIPS